MLEKKIIVEKIQFLMAKYDQLMIYTKLSIKNFEPKNIQKFTTFNKNNQIIFKKNKILYKINGEYGLFLCIIIVIHGLKKNNNFCKKKLIIINNIKFDLSSVSEYDWLENDIFLSVCENLFLYKNCFFEDYFDIEDNLNFFLFFKLDPFLYEINWNNVNSFFFLDFCQNININLFLKTNNIKHSILKNTSNDFKKNNKNILLAKLEYLEIYYYHIVMLRLLFKKTKNNIISAKREYFNYGVINYYSEFHEYISFNITGIYCGLLIIKNEISIYNKLNEEENISCYTQLQINNNSYSLDFNLQEEESLENSQKFLCILEDFCNHKRFKLILDKKQQKDYIYFFYNKTPFDKKTFDTTLLNYDKIYTINNLNISQKQDTYLEYKNIENNDDFGYDYFSK